MPLFYNMLCIEYGPRPRCAVCLGCDMALGPFVLYTFGYDNVSSPPVLFLSSCCMACI